MATTNHNHGQHKSKDWEGSVEEWFLKLPPLSKNAREAIFKITPWIALIFGILGVFGALAGFGILTALSPFVILSYGFGGVIGSVLHLVAAVLLLLAYPGTKAGKYQGWKLLFWSEAINLLASIIFFSPMGIIINLIGFYLLFQIRSYYK